MSAAVDLPPAPATPVRSSHFVLALLALATGGFAIGTTEFVTMGLVPQIADGVDVSIPVAGHVISAYALGVVVGAPILAAFGARLPRRGLLIALMVAFVIGNVASALAASYHLLTLARFFAGLPHGAYFGVASIVAASLARPGRKGQAVATVMLGLSVANVVGVPAATWMGQQLGYRSAYVLVSGLGLLTVAMIGLFIPSLPGDREASGRRELVALKLPQVQLTLLAGAAGFGGMFAVLSYVAKTVTVDGGLGQGAVPIFLLVFGAGGVIGTWLAGRLADWSIMKSLIGSAAASIVIPLVYWATVPSGWGALPAAFLLPMAGSVLVINLQLRLMAVAGDAQTIGAAMNHASLNIANALGAWLGGLVIAAGLGFRAPALVGAGLAAIGLAILLVSAWLQRRDDQSAAVRS